MTDIAFDLIAKQLQGHQGQGLWVVDENISPVELSRLPLSTDVKASLWVLTNRYDVAKSLELLSFQVIFNDFDLSVWPPHFFDVIYYRVSKEKAVVHHVINQSAPALKAQARLLLSGFKNEGIKTYVDKASHYLGRLIEKRLGGKTSMIAEFRADGEAREALEDHDYQRIRDIQLGKTPALMSKPGVFGWQKIDQGSAYLIDFLPQVVERINRPIDRVADLGCGYGYLSVMAHQLLPVSFFATDNNIAAVNCCRENFALHAIEGEVSADSCGESMAVKVDLVLCNPPFHQGFGIETDLTERFIRSAARLLATGGYALFVVNAFIAIEDKARAYFASVVILDNNKRFKLLLMRK